MTKFYRLSSLSSLFLLCVFAFVAIPASALKLATRIVPNHLPTSTGDKMAMTFAPSTNPAFKGLEYFFATKALESDSPIAPGARIFSQAVGDGNLWMVVEKNGAKYPWRLLFSQYGNRQGQVGKSSMIFNLVDSGIEGSDGKWKVNAVGLTCWNLREENGTFASQSPNVPCVITVNGIDVELEKSASEQYIICDFPEDQQWTDILQFEAKMDAAVGITKIVLYIEDVEGFNSSKADADKLLYADDGVYTICAPKTGSLDFTEDLKLALLDETGNPVKYNTENKADGTFSLKRQNGFQKPLPVGKYYACYIVDDNEDYLRQNEGLAFEIIDNSDDAVDEIAADEASYEYYSLSGTRIASPVNGPAIRLKIYDNGIRKAEKIIISDSKSL